MRPLILACVLTLTPAAAQAGAWTQANDSWQVISGIILSSADRSFDGSGNAATPELFRRALFQADIEYGWSDALTLFARPETAYAHVNDSDQAPITALDNAIEAGARYRFAQNLLFDGDLVSVEASARDAGAFNFAVSANAQTGGYGGGLRFLYGSPFKLWGHDGFIDTEAAEEILSRPRPDETSLDLTAGIWATDSVMLMLQNFNLVSGGAVAPYHFFRSHKVEASAVWKLSPLLSLQGGVFFSPAGQNALDEQGICLSVWSNF